MEKVDKKVLCYNIITYHFALLDFDVSLLSDFDVLKSLERLEQLSYRELLEKYDMLHTMFLEKFGFEEEF